MMNEERILAYLQNELSESDRHDFERQLDSDRQLQEAFQAMKADLVLLEIEDYLEGHLSEEATIAFEAKLAQDEQLRIEVERQQQLDFLITGMEVADQLSSNKLEQTGDDEPTLSSMRRQRLRWIALAAGVLLLVVAGISYSAIQARYSNTGIVAAWSDPSFDVTLKGSSVNGSEFRTLSQRIQKASQTKTQQDDQEVITTINTALEQPNLSDTLRAQLQYALVSLWLKQTSHDHQQTITVLETLQTQTHLFEDANFSDEITWYLAIAYLKADNETAANVQLEQLKNSDRYYQERAKQLQRDLNSSWRKVFGIR